MGLTRPRFNQLQESDFKSSCRVATTSNVTLSGGTPATVDGVNLQVNDRVLVTGQTDATENGIYFVSTLGSGSNGSWTRALDANENAEVSSGLILTVTEGTLHSSSIWKLTTADPITIGGTELTFVPNLENSNVYVKALDISDSLATIDSFSASGVTTVRWLISATDNVGGYHKTSTVDAVTDGTTITEIEYGVLLSDSAQDVVTIGTTISGGNILLQGTGTSANVSVRVNRITLGSDTTTGYIRAQVLASAASAVDLSAVDQDIIPATDITYDLGSSSYRWRDLYLSGSTIDLGGAKIKTDDTTGSIAFVPPVTESNPNPSALVVSATGETSVATTSGGVLTTGNIQSAVPSAPPKISSVAVADSSYTELDDTAVALEGGYIIITGAGFVNGCQVLIDGTLASSISVINSTTIHAQIGAKTAGTYTMYVVNPDGATGVRVNAITYSATPTWVTNSTLASQSAGASFSISLSATGATSYALAAGSSLPAGVTLASNGTLSGTVTGIASETTYNFTVAAIDAENQDSPRTFSVTVTVNQPWTVSSSATLITNATANMSNYLRGAYSGFYFSPDGTKLFVNNNVNNQTVRYPVSPAFSLTGFDFPDATYSQGLSVSHISFKSDGTKFYRSSYGSDTIIQYNLSTAWVPNSDTSTNSFDVSSKTATVAGFYFSPDGSKLFFTGNDATKSVYRYDLSTPWSIASGTTYVSSFDVSSLSSIRHIYFKTDGTRMFISSENGTTGNGQVQQFNLSTAWDITTATLISTFSTASYNQAGVYGMWFSADGEYMILGTTSSSYLYKFNTNA